MLQGEVRIVEITVDYYLVVYWSDPTAVTCFPLRRLGTVFTTDYGLLTTGMTSQSLPLTYGIPLRHREIRF
jgi:hypothetical protein